MATRAKNRNIFKHRLLLNHWPKLKNYFSQISPSWYQLKLNKMTTRAKNRKDISHTSSELLATPHSAVGNMSDYRCVSDCRSRGLRVQSQPGPIMSWRLIMKYFLRPFSSLPLIHSRSVVVSYKRKYVHEVLVNLLFKLAQEKCG